MRSKKPASPPAAKKRAAKKKPPKPTKQTKQQQQRKTAEERAERVAQAKSAGLSATAIARSEGISRQWVHALLNSPSVEQIIVRLTNERALQLADAWEYAIAAIVDCLTATKSAAIQIRNEDKSTSVEVVDLGPDHYARMTGVKRLLELTIAGRPVPKPPEGEESGRKLTWDEWRTMLAESERQKTELLAQRPSSAQSMD